MTVSKKSPTSQSVDYKVAAAARRLKLASTAEPIPDEIKPVQGKVRIRLQGKPISGNTVAQRFERSLIDIPEYSIVRKTNKR